MPVVLVTFFFLNLAAEKKIYILVYNLFVGINLCYKNVRSFQEDVEYMQDIFVHQHHCDISFYFSFSPFKSSVAPFLVDLVVASNSSWRRHVCL